MSLFSPPPRILEPVLGRSASARFRDVREGCAANAAASAKAPCGMGPLGGEICGRAWRRRLFWCGLGCGMSNASLGDKEFFSA